MSGDPHKVFGLFATCNVGVQTSEIVSKILTLASSGRRWGIWAEMEQGSTDSLCASWASDSVIADKDQCHRISERWSCGFQGEILRHTSILQPR